jgi:hypothetical protein
MFHTSGSDSVGDSAERAWSQPENHKIGRFDAYRPSNLPIVGPKSFIAESSAEDSTLGGPVRVGSGAVVLTRTRKLVYTVLLFAVAIGLVFVASAMEEAGPLFLVWIPLLTVPWLLTRPEPGDPPREAPETTSETDGAGAHGGDEDRTPAG